VLHGSVFSLLLFAIVVDVITECEMLFVGDLVLMSETMEGLRKFWKWKEANPVLCVKCRKWIHGRCVKVKRVTLRLGRDFVCGRCKKQGDGLMDPAEKLCEEVETVRGFCYLQSHYWYSTPGVKIHARNLQV